MSLRNSKECTNLGGYLLNDGMVHLSTDDGAVRLDEDVVGFAVFNDGLLLAEWV